VKLEDSLAKALLNLHTQKQDEIMKLEPQAGLEAVWNAATGAVLVEVFVNMHGAMRQSDGSLTFQQIVATAIEVAEATWTRFEDEIRKNKAVQS
jgi:hypothetical protein